MEVVELAEDTGTSDGCPTAAYEAVASKPGDTANGELPVSTAAPAEGWLGDASEVAGTDVAAAAAAAVGVKPDAADGDGDGRRWGSGRGRGHPREGTQRLRGDDLHDGGSS